MNMGDIAKVLAAPLSCFPWLEENSHAQQVERAYASRVIPYDTLLNDYYQAVRTASGMVDASQDAGHDFLSGLKSRLEVLGRLHELTPWENRAPEAVLQGNRAALKHCALVGGSRTDVEQRLRSVLDGTLKSPFLTTERCVSTRIVHEHVMASSEISICEKNKGEFAVKRPKRLSVDIRGFPGLGIWLELATTLGVDSPGIVKALDFGDFVKEEYENHFVLDIAMESAAHDLSCVVVRDLPHALSLMDQLLSLYAAAHRGDLGNGRALVLRDIKPTNVLVFSGECLKLCDFALSVYAADLSLQDLSDHRVGTAGYIPLEARCDPENKTFLNRFFLWSKRGDVYSLGTLCFHLLAFRTLRPINEAGLYAQVQKFLENPNDFSKIPTLFALFLRRCLTSDLTDGPESRYRDIEEAREEFTKIKSTF